MARIAEAVEAGQIEIVDRAGTPHEPIDDRAPLKVALGLMLGLLVGSGGALLAEHLNTTIRRREDIEDLLQIPGIGVIPRIAAKGNSGMAH